MRRQLEEIALNQVKQPGTGLTPSLPIPDGLAQSAAAAALTAKSDHLVGNTENEGEQGAAAAAAARKKVMEVQKRACELGCQLSETFVRQALLEVGLLFCFLRGRVVSCSLGCFIAYSLLLSLSLSLSLCVSSCGFLSLSLLFF